MVRLLFLVTYNLIVFVINKIRYRSHWSSHWFQRISPNADVKIFRNGTISIGRNCEFAAGCDVQAHGEGKLTVGDRTYMNRYCMISCQKSVTIGKNCMFGPGVKVFDNNHKFSYDNGVSSDLSCGSIVIGDNCWIASNAIILKGANIGDNCVIGAGCIISGDVPSGSIVRVQQTQTIEEIRR